MCIRDRPHIVNVSFSALRHSRCAAPRGAEMAVVSQPSATCSTSLLTASVPFQSPAPQSGTLSLISSGTWSSVQSVSDVCLKPICSLERVRVSWRLLRYINILTYLLTNFGCSGRQLFWGKKCIRVTWLFWPRNDLAPLLRWRRHCRQHLFCIYFRVSFSNSVVNRWNLRDQQTVEAPISLA